MPVAPTVAGLARTIASSVWGSGFELDDLSGTHGNDVVGSILNYNSDTPFDTHVTAIFVPFTPPDSTFYVTSNLSEFSTMITQTANHQFSDSLGTVVTAFGTEHIYKVEMTGGLTVSGVLCADNSKRPFFIRFWNGDPALTGPKLVRKMNQTEILDRLKSGGKMGLQFIDAVKHSHGDDADDSRKNAQKELWELHRKGLVKYTRGASGQLDMWEAI